MKKKATKTKRRNHHGLSVGRYSPRRKAEFLLNNAVGASDYRRARKEVRLLGLNPDLIPHQAPHD